MSSGIFKKDGRTLFFEDGKLREVHQGKNALLLYRYFSRDTFEVIGTFVGIGVILGLIVGVSASLPLPVAALFGFIVGTFSLLVAASIHDKLFITEKQKTSGSVVNAGETAEIFEDLTTEEIFEYHDSIIQQRGLKGKVEYANNLLENTNSDSPIYEDLKKKKESLKNEYNDAAAYVDTIGQRFKARVESKQKSEKEQEALEFLNAA